MEHQRPLGSLRSMEQRIAAEGATDRTLLIWMREDLLRLSESIHEIGSAVNAMEALIAKAHHSPCASLEEVRRNLQILTDTKKSERSVFANALVQVGLFILAVCAGTALTFWKSH